MDIKVKEQRISDAYGITIIRDFASLNDFYNYINTQPVNDAFEGKEKSSINSSYKFSQTNSYKEAVELFQNGWTTGAEELTHKVNIAKQSNADETTKRLLYDVVGFQASVPRYLQGIPTNMVNQKVVPVKQKIITINKDISYCCLTTTQEIMDSSVKLLGLIQKIEAQGVRVNLNVIFAVGDVSKHYEIVKVRVKSSNEKINISKMAFPLVHPSMLRRLMLRYIEVAPTITKGYVKGYGKPMPNSTIQKHLKGEYVLPRLMTEQNSLDDLEIYCSK